MADTRLQRFADVLVNYSVGVKPGERLAISGEAVAAPLFREIYRYALQAGAFTYVMPTIAGLSEIFLKEASTAQLQHVNQIQSLMLNEFETSISFWAETNTKSLNNVDHSKMAIRAKAHQHLMETYMQRTMDGTYRWVAALYPTDASAQDAEMSTSDFEDFCYRACFLDTDNPVERWQQLSREQDRYVNWLKGKETVHIVGQDTDLTFSIKDRPFVNCDGHLNFPDGEFFTSPIENTANGYIRYSFPCTYNGVSIEDVRLKFEDGKAVSATAAKGQDYLDQMLATDEGARRIGEFAFGNNPFVDRCIRHTLFDEKMYGTIHIALGKSIPMSKGVNDSAIHWDMVCDLRAGSEIRVDGDIFAKDGKFAV
jgi:aminopeptidase